MMTHRNIISLAAVRLNSLATASDCSSSLATGDRAGRWSSQVDPNDASSPPSVVPFPLVDDPAVLVCLAIRLGVAGRVRREGIPGALRERLRAHAKAGEPACALILDWLDRLLIEDLEAASGAGPTS